MLYRGAKSLHGGPLAALAAFAAHGAALGGALRAENEAAARVNFAEYLELLRHRNVAAVTADIRRNADFLEQVLVERGFRVSRVDNAAGRPAVIAELDGSAAGAPTVLFYIHYDGQPVTPEEWSQRDPFEPVVRRRGASGAWEDAGQDSLQREPLAHELRVFARSASDDKAPIAMLLTAIDVLRTSGRRPAFNLKVLLDGEEETFRRRVGIARPERVGESLQEALQYPSLNVRGLAAGGVGPRAANAIPSEAVAEIDIRTTPETDGRRLFELVKAHIERQGYRLAYGPPTDDERARYVKLATFTLGSIRAAARMPMESAIGRWAAAALRASTAPRPDEEPVRVRMLGGTLPTDVLVAALDLPFVLVPTVNEDNNQHARDENLRIGDFITGTEIVYTLLTTPFER